MAGCKSVSQCGKARKIAAVAHRWWWLSRVVSSGRLRTDTILGKPALNSLAVKCSKTLQWRYCCMVFDFGAESAQVALTLIPPYGLYSPAASHSGVPARAEFPPRFWNINSVVSQYPFFEDYKCKFVVSIQCERHAWM